MTDLHELRREITYREADGDVIYAIVMPLSTALSLSRQIVTNFTMKNDNMARQFGYPIVINEDIPSGEWVISSQPRYVAQPWLQEYRGEF